MNKLLPIIFAFLCFSFNSQAQQENIDQIDVNAGIGLLPTIIGTSFGIPISVSVNHPFSKVEHLTVGGYAGFFSTSVSNNYGFGTYDINYKVFLFGARATYHLGHFEWMSWMKSDKLDPYTGVMIGFNLVKSSYDDNINGNPGVTGSSPTASGFIGTKYKLNESFKAFAELGYGISLATVGITFSL